MLIYIARINYQMVYGVFKMTRIDENVEKPKKKSETKVWKFNAVSCTIFECITF